MCKKIGEKMTESFLRSMLYYLANEENLSRKIQSNMYTNI